MIITVSSTTENVGITTLSLEIARNLASRVRAKPRRVSADEIILIEADPAGGILAMLMPGVGNEQTNALQSLLSLSTQEYDQGMRYGWTGKEHGLSLRIMFSNFNAKSASISLKESEGKLCDYLDNRDDWITVIDTGRVVTKRESVAQADVSIWILDPNHPNSIIRTKEMALEGILVEGEKSFAVIKGAPSSMTGSIERDIRMGVIGYLPDPEAKLGKHPSKKYRKEVDKLTDYILSDTGIIRKK